MLMGLVYEPDKDDVIYHYCSVSTFQAIATSGTIRFSDINMCNDASEVHWAYKIFEDAATRLLNRVDIPSSVPKIDEKFIDAIDKIVSPIQLIAHPFIACFSQEPDMLIQWKAYADDGRGFVLGFRAQKLRAQLPIILLRVLYDPELQVKEMMAAILTVFEGQRSGDEKILKAKFFEDCVMLATFMVAFKHPSFRNENEIRAVHVINVRVQGKLYRFSDPGGIINNNIKVQGCPVEFQIRDNNLVAYIDKRFLPPDVDSPLNELILGPKNCSAPGNLALFLGGLGFSEVTVRQSSTPYR